MEIQKNSVDYGQILGLEKETEYKASETLEKIEEAVEAWKAAGNKPESLEPAIRNLQKFYNELIEWERGSLADKKGSDLKSHLNNLREFAIICTKYQQKFEGF